MDEKIKFSIIVPVYNVVDYIERCIISLLSQTYSNFELLLVDDGSTDGSDRICDLYSLKDLRVKTFHKKNAGVSSARNLGLDEATGDYVTFVDSDDYIGKNTLLGVYESVILENIDIIEFPCTYNVGNKQREKINKSDCIIKFAKMHDIVNYWFYNPRFEACTKFYRLESINNRRFKEYVKVGEDTLFFLCNLIECNSYIVLPDGMYYYCYRESSVMNSLTNEMVLKSDLLLLNEVFNSDIVKNNQLLNNFIYRIVVSKLTNKDMLQDSTISFKYFSPFIERISYSKMIFSNSPLKVKIVLFLLKSIGVSGFVNILRCIR